MSDQQEDEEELEEYEPQECEECGCILPRGHQGIICSRCDYDNHFDGW